MKVQAIHRDARMSPRKIRLVAALMRGLSVQDAEDQLTFLPGQAPVIIKKVLRSAVANAVNNFNLDEKSLKVTEVIVNKGLVMKRFQPVSKGMAHPILKRTSHVTVVVDGEAAAEKKKAKVKKIAIETLSADQYTAKEERQIQTEQAEQEAKKKKPTEERAVETTKDVTEYEAYGKVKMMQRGGDKKKAHRRKSIG